MDYYWELQLFDDTKIDIPPTAVEVIKRRMGTKEPINLKTQVIPTNQIKSFHITNRPFGQALLLDEVSQAFNEPQVNTDGSIVCKWVKRPVTNKMWDTHYSRIPAYRSLGSDGVMVTIAFKQPVHQIDVAIVQVCTDDEIKALTNR